MNNRYLGNGSNKGLLWWSMQTITKIHHLNNVFGSSILLVWFRKHASSASNNSHVRTWHDYQCIGRDQRPEHKMWSWALKHNKKKRSFKFWFFCEIFLWFWNFCILDAFLSSWDYFLFLFSVESPHQPRLRVLWTVLVHYLYIAKHVSLKLRKSKADM